MNEKKICFIMCVNNSQYEQECIRFIQNLSIPDGYEIEQLSVYEAESMTSGYNEAMESSDAKYKVYLHQDVFIVNKNFIIDMLRVFENPDIGMFGMAGSVQLPKDGIMWSGDRVGRLYTSNVNAAGDAILGRVNGIAQEVEAVDGLLIATQYDVAWRADLFTGWDFYDISQSMEFRRKGYKVVVPNMNKPWCIHDDGLVNLATYFEWRDVFLKEYADLMN